MKKPSPPKLNLNYVAPLHELGLEVDSDKAKQLGQLLKKYYFGYSNLKAKTVSVYFMVSPNCILNL